MKLKLKHLAPYLPYGLNLFYTHTNKIGQISNIYTIGKGYDNDDIKISIDFTDGEHIWMYKPILRPLSDLTKEIEHNGQIFVPLKKLLLKASFFEIKSKIEIDFDNETEVDVCVYSNECILHYNKIFNNFYFEYSKESESHFKVDNLALFNKMFEWHFDVFGLIEKGLAIDINKIKE